MVDKNDVVYLKSLNSGRGGLPSVTQIVSATPNNVFDDLTPTQLAAGRTEYRCIYIKNEHDTETMKDVHVWMQSDNPNSVDATAQWALDPITGGYDGGMALRFRDDIIGDNASLGNHSDLWSTTLTKFSFVMWIFPEKGGDGIERMVLQHGENTNSAFWCSLDPSDPTKINFKVRNSGGTTATATSSNLTLNAWNQIICVYDNTLGSANVKIYVDSVLGSTTGNMTSSINGSFTLFLGAETIAPHLPYVGYMSGFSFFKTKALSQSQVIDSFEGDYLADGDDPDYLIYMDEGSGFSLDDEKSTKTGTLNGSDMWADAFLIPDDTTAPPVETWYDVTNGPVSNTPNIGDIRPNLSTPIWIKWTVTAGADDAKNDYAVIVVEGKIPEEATAPTTPNQGETDPPVVPTSVPNFTVGYCADWDATSDTDDVVSLIKSWSPKLVLSGGDLMYECGVGDWYDAMKPIDDNAGSGRPRLETAFGNHDNGESECDSNEKSIKSHFKLNNSYYSFNYENVHVLVLDNTDETDFSKGSSQYNFAKSDLEAARKNAKVTWIFVVFHKPMFGSDTKHGYNEGNFNQAYQPLFDANKVDLVLTGHNHNWQRTVPVKYNSSSPTSPKIAQSGGGPYTGGNGTVVYIVGTGGHDSVGDLYDLDTSPSYIGYKSNDHLGALRIDVSNNGKTLTCKLYDIDGGSENTIVINR